MSDQRYVVLGLAHVRSAWFTEVARWSTSGSLPVEFVKCVSLAELRARLSSGRPFSAALLDGRLPAVDRDLLAVMGDAGIVTLVVAAGDRPADWPALGATAVLGDPLDRATLLDALASHARLIGPLDDHGDDVAALATPAPWRGRLVAVASRSGGGGSTLAAATAQHLAADPRNAAGVVLVDLARHAHQALLHDARDVVPGIQELVEAHRNGRPGPDQVRRLSFDVPTRGYRLILGMRRPGDWVTIRSRAFAAALDGLRNAARLVVADVDTDLEGEAETGSFDVEDRNLIARRTVAEADLVVVVATPTLTGVHGLVTQIDDLRRFGVAGGRILAVINRAPRARRSRAELVRAVANLTGADDKTETHLGPVFVPERRGLDDVQSELARFPRAVAGPVGSAVAAALDRLSVRSVEPEPTAIAPGSLGTWTDGEEAIS